MQGIELSFIAFLQTRLDWLLPVMRIFSEMGQGYAYALFIAAFLWCIHTPTGIRMALFLSLSGCSNEVLKQAFHEPRPYWVTDSVKCYNREFAFGMPSGHSNAVIVWLLAAARGRKKAYWIPAGCMVFSVGISRAFMGVHFPHQILAGWLFGGMILAGFLLLEPPLLRWVRKSPPLWPILAALAASIAIIALGQLFVSRLSGFEIPADWQARVAPLLPAGKKFAPVGLGRIPGDAGSLFGFCAGALLLDRLGGMSAAGSIKKRLQRLPAGLVILAPLLALLHLLPVPGQGALLPIGVAYTKGALLAFGVILAVPLALRRLGLAEPAGKAA